MLDNKSNISLCCFNFNHTLLISIFRHKYLNGLLLWMSLFASYACSSDPSGGGEEPAAEEPAPVVERRQFSVTVSAGTGGSVNTAGGLLVEGSSLTLTATPDSGYVFESWSNGSTENPLTIVVNGTLTLQANFTRDTQGGTQTTLLEADGPGNTYALITSVLAPNYNPIEVPDCNHESFGDHIDELFDETLNKNVFRFYIHTTPDNDRCINFDRQRNEIKAYNQSPENLLGREGEYVTYRWKFKLATGFQSSPNFTHIHQLKSVGGDLAGMPMYTLTTRKGNPDRMELRYAETDQQITLTQTDLTPFLGQWVTVEESVLYAHNGAYRLTLKNTQTDELLMSYTNESIVNWRAGGEFVRPKWGIYRSLLQAEDLRDEALLFADFSVTE